MHEAFRTSVQAGTELSANQLSSRPFRVEGLVLAYLDVSEPGRKPVHGDHLALENSGWSYHQMDTEWITLRPDIAFGLGWEPDGETPGGWLAPAGELAVSTVRWADGWPGRTSPNFEDSENMGYAVVATPLGLAELQDLGPLTRSSSLKRTYSKADAVVDSVSKTAVKAIATD